MRLLDWLLKPLRRWLHDRRYRKRLAEMRRRDPFIYK